MVQGSLSVDLWEEIELTTHMGGGNVSKSEVSSKSPG